MTLMEFVERYAAIMNMLALEQALLAKQEQQVETLRVEKERNVKALAVLDKAVEIVSANGIGTIERTVSDGLRLTFGADYQFIIERKEGVRGDSYRFLVQRGEIQGPPMDTMGGGVVNVVAFLLRIIMIQRFGLSPLVVLDESFNNVSQHYLSRVSQMLRTLADSYNYTILAITQAPKLAESATKVFMVEAGPTLTEVAPDA